MLLLSLAFFPNLSVAQNEWNSIEMDCALNPKFLLNIKCVSSNIFHRHRKVMCALVETHHKKWKVFWHSCMIFQAEALLLLFVTRNSFIVVRIRIDTITGFVSLCLIIHENELPPEWWNYMSSCHRSDRFRQRSIHEHQVDIIYWFGMEVFLRIESSQKVEEALKT